MTLYRYYLNQEQQPASEIWECYVIHVFLDEFLYYQRCDYARRSKFEFIFFSNNLRGLVLWLRSAAESGRCVTISDTEAFLARQTKYYLALSQRITLEENEILNTRKDLLRYDAATQVVRLGHIPAQPLAEAQQLYRELQTTSLGCPFGRSKGRNTNTLAEIYGYYDRLFVQILELAWEFDCLSHRAHDAEGDSTLQQ